MHLFIDEADTFAPQKTSSALQFECLGTVTRLVSQGGSGGVGVTMITQRSAKINWDVLSQVDILTVLRMGAPNDIKPVVEWLQSETSKEFAAQVKAELPSLPVGTAFMASAPLEMAARVEVRQRRTFNSGATPKPGQRHVVPTVLAAIDLAKLGREITETVERARENSPEVLRARIVELERAGKQVPSGGDSARKLAELRAEVDRLKPAAEQATRLAAELLDADKTTGEVLAALRILVERFESRRPVHVEKSSTKSLGSSVPPAAALKSKLPVVEAQPVAVPSSGGLSTSEQKILDALASLEAVGVDAPSKTQLAAFAGYSNARSGGFAAPALALVRGGLVESSAGRASMTASGRAAANKPGRPATTNGLQERIFSLLGEGERKLLTLLIAAHPGSLRRVELAERGGYSNARSGRFAGPLRRLIELGFVDAVNGGVVRGNEMLFWKRKAGNR